jgi:hypothetical protein
MQLKEYQPIIRAMVEIPIDCGTIHARNQAEANRLARDLYEEAVRTLRASDPKKHLVQLEVSEMVFDSSVAILVKAEEVDVVGEHTV